MCIVNDIKVDADVLKELLPELEHDMTPDELYRVIEQDIDAIYATK